MRHLIKGLFIVACGLSGEIADAGTKEADENDRKRLAVIAEAEALFKKKQYARAKTVLENGGQGVIWYVDRIFAKKQRLLGQVLIRTKDFEAARNANLSAFRLNPALTDAVYDNACASALEGRSEDALRQIEILWHTVASDKSRLARYAKLLKKDDDFKSIRKRGTFSKLQDSFTTGKNPTAAGYQTDPGVFAVVGDDIASGLATHDLLSHLLCGDVNKPGFTGISLAIPGKVILSPAQFRLPVCFTYAFASKDIKAAKKKAGRAPDMGFRFELTAPDGKKIIGTYRGENNSKDHRTGKVLEHPIDPPEDVGADIDGGDYITGGNEITDVTWHIGRLTPIAGKYQLRVYNDVYQSPTQPFTIAVNK